MKKKKPSILKRYKPFMGNRAFLFPLSLILSAISSILGLLPFVFIWFIIRELLEDKMSVENVKLYAFLSLLFVFLSILTYFFSLLSSHIAAFRAEVRMRAYALKKLANMPLGYFSHHQSGKIRNIVDESASATHSFLAHQMPDLSASIVAPLTLVVLIFTVDWKFGLVSLIPISLGFISMTQMMSKEGEEKRKEYMKQLELMSAEAVEYIRGIPVVKTFGGSVHAFKRFTEAIGKYKEFVISITLLWQKPMSAYTAIAQSTAFFLVPFAIFLINDTNKIQVLSDFMFYLLIAPNFALIFMKSMHFQNNLSVATHILDRFEKLLDYKNIEYKNDEVELKNYNIEFKNVSFSYEKDAKNALNDISFKVSQGKSIALVGASGSGKSTIAKLVARFWDITNGEINIGDVNIKDIPKTQLMNSIAFVFQSTKLFSDTLRSNITLGRKVGEKELSKAIKLSQSEDIIQKIPLETTIGSKGVYLSGGEQQRIALARAILKDAPIVLLDEATAFADPENEHQLQQALNELRDGKTTIMIAHRLTSVKDVDEILVIDDGCIVQKGSHEELLKSKGMYKKMWDEYQKSTTWALRSER